MQMGFVENLFVVGLLVSVIAGAVVVIHVIRQIVDWAITGRWHH